MRWAANELTRRSDAAEIGAVLHEYDVLESVRVVLSFVRMGLPLARVLADAEDVIRAKLGPLALPRDV